MFRVILPFCHQPVCPGSLRFAHPSHFATLVGPSRSTKPRVATGFRGIQADDIREMPQYAMKKEAGRMISGRLLTRVQQEITVPFLRST